VKRITQDVSKWHVILGREARGLAAAERHDQPGLQFQDELFGRLYDGEVDQLDPADRDQPTATVQWAEGLHEAASQLPAFGRLTEQVRGNAAQAGLAVDQLVAALGDQADRPRPNKPQDQKARDTLRRSLGQAVQKVQVVIDDVEEALEGLAWVAWGGPGQADQEPGANVRLEGELLRRLASQAGQNDRLVKIAKMAGRFSAIAANKVRTRVHHGADEIVDIEMGADLSRVLPVALVKLRHPVLRATFLRDFHERALPQYRMAGTETLGRGPIVVMLDKSASMTDRCGGSDVTRDEWATAIMLALLDQAVREHRTFCVIPFDGRARGTVIVRPGEKMPLDTLLMKADGQRTDIDAGYRAALRCIAQEPAVGRADIVILTDGESYATEGHDALRLEAQAAGITTYGVGIAVPASALAPWCDQIESVDPNGSLDNHVADMLFGQAA
jgi:uncharacterized protein with von Willebrand factor type A (vWA) domain